MFHYRQARRSSLNGVKMMTSILLAIIVLQKSKSTIIKKLPESAFPTRDPGQKPAEVSPRRMDMPRAAKKPKDKPVDLRDPIRALRLPLTLAYFLHHQPIRIICVMAGLIL